MTDIRDYGETPDLSKVAPDTIDIINSLKGMLESYEVLINTAKDHFKNEVLVGAIQGAFTGEIGRAQTLISRYENGV